MLKPAFVPQGASKAYDSVLERMKNGNYTLSEEHKAKLLNSHEKLNTRMTETRKQAEEICTSLYLSWLEEIENILDEFDGGL